MNIQEAIKEKTVIHCETEEEAERILNMAHKLGYRWNNGRSYKGDYKWGINESATSYNILNGLVGNIWETNNTIIPSAQIADIEEEKSTDWTPEDTEAIEKLPIDKVTIKNLDIALRMVGIQLDVNIIDKVIDLVELIENKGDDVTIKDIVSLQQTWKRHLLKYGPVLIC